MTPLNWIPLLQFKTNPTPYDVKFVLAGSEINFLIQAPTGDQV